MNSHDSNLSQKPKTMIKPWSLALVILILLGIITLVKCCFFTPRIFYDSNLRIHTFLDSNANGSHEAVEQPLSGICVWNDLPFSTENMAEINDKCSRSYYLTDTEGVWDEFKPGAKCTDITSYAMSPDGYISTTPLKLTGCEVWFGFIPVGFTPRTTPTNLPKSSPIP
jgi:hypothetical protein